MSRAASAVCVREGWTSGSGDVAAILVPRAAVGVLYGFHAWLFCHHLWTGRLADNGVVLRWAAGLLILGAFVALRRLGVPLLHGRKAVVLWLLVVLLHCHAVWSTPDPAVDARALQELATMLAVQVTAVPIALGAALFLCVRVRRAVPAVRPLPRLDARGLVAARSAGHVLLLAPRPPPLG